jgi:hypothetical protein
MEYNITTDFDLYSLLLDRKFKIKEFIKYGVKVEFYQFTDGWNKNYTQIEEYVETEIHLKFESKSNEFFYCYSYDTKNLKVQTLLSKSNPFMKISIPLNFNIYELDMSFYLIDRTSGHTNYMKLGNYTITDLISIMKSFVTYLQNPYKFQCSYYDTNQNPFNSVSHEHCLYKCSLSKCEFKYK